MMIKLAIAATATMMTLAGIVGVNAMTKIENQEIYSNTTKAKCLKKKGYIWIAETGKCVKDTRGSY